MPEINIDDTIAAIATPIGEGGISVIRVSGNETFPILSKIFYSPKIVDLKNLPSHTIYFGVIRDDSGNILDQVLISLFRAPNSYTGQNVIEVSSHGGLIVTRKILELIYQNGARPAEPGEFTKRAFLNGKIDLTQAEAVSDLIRAKSEKSLRMAVEQLAGTLSKKFRALRDEMMLMYAHMESFLDFPEEDLEIYEDQAFFEKFEKVRAEIQLLLDGFKRGALIREGISVVLVGKPNVGKSSLFNLLLARDRALVSEYPGTTRDALEEAIEIGGIYMKLLDTAGLGQDLHHPIDKMGMERTRQVLESGDLFIYLLDGSIPLDESDKVAFQSIPQNKPILLLINKSDLPQKADWKQVCDWGLLQSVQPLFISTKNREGIAQLEKRIMEMVFGSKAESGGEQIVRLRHKHALERSLKSWQAAQETFQNKSPLEIVIVDLKAALDELRELIGEIYSEDLLDVIFSEFCIGK